MARAKNNVNNKVRPQNKHLKPLKKGETANPNGRPKGQRNYATIYREALLKLAAKDGIDPDDYEVMLLETAIKSAKKGDHRFYKDLMDRLHGTAVQKTDVTSGGEKIVTNAIIFADLDEANS